MVETRHSHSSTPAARNCPQALWTIPARGGGNLFAPRGVLMGFPKTSPGPHFRVAMVGGHGADCISLTPTASPPGDTDSSLTFGWEAEEARQVPMDARSSGRSSTGHRTSWRDIVSSGLRSGEWMATSVL